MQLVISGVGSDLLLQSFVALMPLWLASGASISKECKEGEKKFSYATPFVGVGASFKLRHIVNLQIVMIWVKKCSQVD